MSVRNGDKARHGRLRKQKIARRLRMEVLKKSLASPAVEPAAK